MTHSILAFICKQINLIRYLTIHYMKDPVRKGAQKMTTLRVVCLQPMKDTHLAAGEAGDQMEGMLSAHAVIRGSMSTHSCTHQRRDSDTAAGD